MSLGIYMDNLNDYEDIGEKIGIDGESVYVSNDYSPNFKSRHTIQLWKVLSNATIKKWVGETLAEDSLHEIYMKNMSAEDIRINFDDMYMLSDEEYLGEIKLKANDTAHFYCTGMFVDGSFILVMRTGSQDTRK